MVISFILYFVHTKLLSIKTELDCIFSDDRVYIKQQIYVYNVFLYKCYFSCYFNLNVIYLSNILKALDSESLPCQNFIDDYIIIDNFSQINMTFLKIIIMELLKKLDFFILLFFYLHFFCQFFINKKFIFFLFSIQK